MFFQTYLLQFVLLLGRIELGVRTVCAGVVVAEQEDCEAGVTKTRNGPSRLLVDMLIRSLRHLKRDCDLGVSSSNWGWLLDFGL
jgi:hypothetical protein